LVFLGECEALPHSPLGTFPVRKKTEDAPRRIGHGETYSHEHGASQRARRNVNTARRVSRRMYAKILHEFFGVLTLELFQGHVLSQACVAGRKNHDVFWLFRSINRF
jgi:hypothetical protein